MGGVSVGTGCPSGGALGNWGLQAWEVEVGMVAPLLTQASRSSARHPPMPGKQGWSQPGALLLLSHCSRVRLLVTSWTAARQAPLSMRIL